MTIMKITQRTILSILAVAVMASTGFFKANATPLSAVNSAAQPNISVTGNYSMNKAQRGRSLQASVVLDIPSGYHVNSNRPNGKYLIATSVKIDAPSGVRIGAVRYPAARLRKFGFSDEKLSVFEGRTVMRFSVGVPANYGPGKLELKARVRYQSCSDKECYAPVTRDISMWIDVVNAK
jgi:DsbC/DsbD-like thiol-disulfide interchange protein